MGATVPGVRASRLVALLLRLQASGSATAAALARDLEVSERTIYRDVAALQAAGVPLWTETGPGGGIRLVEGWRTQLDGLTADEAGALFLAGAPSVVAELGLGAVLAAAQTKMLAALPPELRGRAARVRERFFVDAPGWFHRDEATPHLATVAEAVWSAKRLDLRYQRSDRVVARRVDPLGLVLKAGTWYLVARHRNDVRTYRVSRVVDARPRDEPATRPEGFDLEAYWTASAADFDRSILHDRVRLRLGPRARRALPHVANPGAAQRALDAATEPGADGWVEVTLEVESLVVACNQLVALGEEVEIVEPPALRRRFAELAAAMLARHS